MSHGKLIVIEGIDGSGKSTQFDMLCKRFERESIIFKRIAFPRYTEPSSALLKMYLGGEFGNNPGDVSAYAASVFFAVDRYASYKLDWGADYQAGRIILSDRYVTSNAVHQGAKLGSEELDEYLNWLNDFEYRIMELPKPDFVLYLDIELDTALRQISSRQAALAAANTYESAVPDIHNTAAKTDIHEADIAYLRRCQISGSAAAEKYSWRRIRCDINGQMRHPGDIHEEIFSLVSKLAGLSPSDTILA